MILGGDQKDDIARRIDYIQIQLQDLDKFKTLDWKTYQKDRDIQRNIERLVENVANASIDISKIILAGEEVEMPNSYKDIILRLAEAGILEETVAAKTAEYAGLRNVLAHQYLDLRWNKIAGFISQAPKIIPQFIEAIKKRL